MKPLPLINKFILSTAAASLFASGLILLSILITAIDTGGSAFYFTLLYENPYGDSFQRASFLFFVVGYSLVLACLTAILLQEYYLAHSTGVLRDFCFWQYCLTLPRSQKWWLAAINREAIFITGLVAVISSLFLIGIPGGWDLHRPAAIIATVTMFIHAFTRRAWWTLIPFLAFGIPTTVFWVVTQNDFLFSLFQTLMGGTLFLSVLLDIILYAMNLEPARMLFDWWVGAGSSKKASR